MEFENTYKDQAQTNHLNIICCPDVGASLFGRESYGLFKVVNRE